MREKTMTQFQKDLEVIIQNTEIPEGDLTFNMRKFQRIGKRDISVLEVGTRAYNVLRRNQLSTIDDVVNNWGGLHNLHSMGITTVKEIKNAILAYYYDHLDNEEKKEFWKDVFGQEG